MRAVGIRIACWRSWSWRSTAVALGVLLGAGLVAGPASLGSASARHASLSGTISYANLPGSNPNYIFPFSPLAFFSVSNSQYFQYLMYRPLYWFGTGTAPTLNLEFSLAKNPIYSDGDRTVTIDLDHYAWSDGEKVTAQDVEFWLNIYRTDPGGYAGYVPGTIPDDIASTSVSNPNQIVLHLTGPVNTYWYTYNELSQITPMPLDWDVTSLSAPAGSQSCATASFSSIVVKVEQTKSGESWIPESAAAKSCEAVYDFLSEQSGYNPTSSASSTSAFGRYTTSKLWTTVDGPWKLKSFDATGNDVFVPNPSYTGPVKPTYAQFVLSNWTSDEAEVDSLFAGTTTIGYLNTQNLTAPAVSDTVPGPNNPRLVDSYDIVMEPTWAIAYAMYNFTANGDGGEAGKIISQLYFRQAMQEAIDQPLYVKKLLDGYGAPTYGPVPVLPANPFVTSEEESNPYPYVPAKARSLLADHGWSIVPGGTDVCQDAAKCGVPAGTKLDLTMSYATGQQWFNDMMTVEKAAWSSLGINVTLLPGTFTEVSGEAIPTNHSWDLANYGLWVFSPDYYPTGEELFETGAGSNAGSYSDPTADRLIKATDFSSSNSYFAKYENYLADQLPYLWQPNAVIVGEVAKDVSGYVPNCLDSLLPETWHLKG